MTLTYRKLRRLDWGLELRLLPRRVWCAASGGHRYGDEDATIMDGPINLPPREREWYVLGVMRQCEKCYRVADRRATPDESARYIREAIAEAEIEEAGWR